MAVTVPVSRSPGRTRLHCVGFALGLVNIMFAMAVTDATGWGLARSAGNLFGISALAWAAIPALFAVMWNDPGDAPASRADWAVFAVLALACLFPVRHAASLAVTLAALRALAIAPRRTPLFRGALIALSVSATLFWGGAFLAMTHSLLLDLDTALAGTLGGLRHEGNMLYYDSADPAWAGKGFIVAPQCSSLHGISIALLAWVLVTQFYDLPLTRRTLVAGLAGIAGTIAVNIARLSAMGHFPARFDWLHEGTGGAIAGLSATLLVLGANFAGNWRAITRG